MQTIAPIFFTSAMEAVTRFHLQALGDPSLAPTTVTPLSQERVEFGYKALVEEATEFKEATTIQFQADALIDSVYFAIGRLVEMGVPYWAAFDDVHQANMLKRLGQTHRGDKQDAVKPPDFVPPNLDWLVAPAIPAFVRAAKVSAMKGNTYNQSGVTLDDYFPLGLPSYYQMLHLKLLRFRALIGKQPLDTREIRGTLIDMMNYAAYALNSIGTEGEAS